MSRTDFDAVLQHRPALAHQIMRVLSLRLRESDNATIADLHEKNRELAQAYADLRAAQAQIIEKEKLERELRMAHRIQQSILMALTRSLLRAEATRVVSPRRALERVNQLLLDMNDEGMFVTLLHGILDARQGTFAYSRAGHELPLLFAPVGSARGRERAGGTSRPIRQRCAR
jgi:hypothetical protein